MPELDTYAWLIQPLSSPFLAVLLPWIFIPRAFRAKDRRAGAMALFIPVVLYCVGYYLAALNDRVAQWLSAVNSPICAVIILLVLPAMHLPRGGKGYKAFLSASMVVLLLSLFIVWTAYREIQLGERILSPVLAEPGWVVAGATAALILVQPLLSLSGFRRLVRLVSFLILIYGGVIFGSNLRSGSEMRTPDDNGAPAGPMADGLSRAAERAGVLFEAPEDTALSAESEASRGEAWKGAQEHRPDEDITGVVVESRGIPAVLPSAPCRFARGGGYVEGCGMEALQRIFQTDFSRIKARESGPTAELGDLLALLLLFVCISFVTARWWCGWVCPLGTMGEAINAIRIKLGQAPLRPAASFKTLLRTAGAGTGGVGLFLANLIPELNDSGKIAGTVIPSMPFCRMCPSYQLCPVVSGGTGARIALPEGEWAFGFLRYGCIVMLALFAGAFLLARRTWCFFCPMGMLSGLFNRGGLFTLRKDPSRCRHCGVCTEVCPMNISRVRDSGLHTNVTDFDCLLCLKCVEKCPQDGCLSLEHAGVKVTESGFERAIK